MAALPQGPGTVLSGLPEHERGVTLRSCSPGIADASERWIEVVLGHGTYLDLACWRDEIWRTHGIPSHDTFSTVLRMLDPKALDAAFGKLAATLAAALAKGGVIAIDGKSLKGAYDKGKKSSPRMMVSAYAAGLRLTLATVAAEERNEVDAALEVLGLIDLKGKIVTGDALHCNRRMVELIVEKGGDYCIALKGNQESLLSDARSCLAAADKPKPGKRPPPTAKTETKAHGRSL